VWHLGHPHKEVTENWAKEKHTVFVMSVLAEQSQGMLPWYQGFQAALGKPSRVRAHGDL
jgi:hypothetical protein